MRQLGKKTIIKKTAEIGASTALSRLLGLFREILQSRYLGASQFSDAFLAAYKIPNFLRKIFAEGALSGILVPAFIDASKKGKAELGRLVSLVFLFVESIVLLVCLIVITIPKFVMILIAPGFTQEKIAITIPLMRVLIFFILFISSSSVIGSALQAVHHFQVPAWGQVLLNSVFIGALYICYICNLPIEVLSYAVLAGALLHFLLHLIVYRRHGFSFGFADKDTWEKFKPIMFKAAPTLVVVGMMDINTWIDSNFASYIPDSMTLLHYGSSFMRIPLGVFGVAFATILLPHFSRMRLYAPNRFSFYIFEAAKLILFITLPAILFMSFVAKKIFLTLFVSGKFTTANALETSRILMAFLVGLFFFSLNKILLNIYYVHRDLMTPTLISLAMAGVNYQLDRAFVPSLQATGLALATSLSGALQTVLFLYFLTRYYNLSVYSKQFFQFCTRFLPLLATFSFLFYLLYGLSEWLIGSLSPSASQFLLERFGFWFWVLPLAGLVSLGLLAARKQCGIKLYFLD